ncbi:MAG: hypothetical protein Aurels2KO_41140 [Aureliella sp.]
MESAEPLNPEVLSGDSSLDVLHLRLARQIAPARWKRPLLALVVQLQAGVTLEAAVEKTRIGMPRELQRLVQAAMSVPNPTHLVLEAVRVRQRTRRSWREFSLATMYPLCLFMIAVVMAVIFNISVSGMMSFSFLDDFGMSAADMVHAQIDDQTQATMGLAIATFWFAGVLLTIRIVGPPWAWTSVIGGLIIVGKPLRWISLEELLHRYRLFSGQGLDTLTAVNAAAASLGQSGQSVVAERVARQVMSGQLLGDAIGDSLLSDGMTRPIVRFVDTDSSTPLAARLERCANILRAITERRCRTLVAVLPILALVVVGTLICSMLFSYMLAFMPLVKMITSLA